MKIQKTFLTIIISLLALSGFSQKHDHLTLEVDFKGNLVKVDARYQAIVKKETKALYFMLNPGFTVKNISGNEVSKHTLEVQKASWRVDFDRTLKVGEKVEIQFEYLFDLATQNHLRSDWIELNVDKLWVPNQTLDNKYTHVATLKNFPKGFKFVSFRDEIIKQDNNGNYILKSAKPAPEILILAGRNMHFWKPKGSFISFFASKNTPDSTLKSMHEKVDKSIAFLNTKHGKSNPLKTMLVVLRNTKRTEIGFQFSRKTMIITGKDFNSYGNLSHELAHYWWSDANFMTEPWLNESFANYSMFLVMEKFSPKAHDKILTKYTKRAKKAPAVIGATVFSKNAYSAYYIKGVVLLKELEKIIGRKKMLKLLKVRVRKNIDTTKGVLTALANIAGQGVSNRFEKMLSE